MIKRRSRSHSSPTHQVASPLPLSEHTRIKGGGVDVSSDHLEIYSINWGTLVGTETKP
jgi:hypothetical protein